MKQPDVTDWCDFVRGVLDPEAEARMRERLASRSREVAALRRVAEVGRRDAEHPVPASAVRIAKAIASLKRPSPAADGAERAAGSILKRLPFTVVADSLLQAAGAGARDMQSAYRHIVFEAEGYSVDVRLEPEREAGTLVLGQLMRLGDRIEPVDDVPVLLVTRDKIVGRALTGELGEFQAAGLPAEPIDLCLLVGAEQCLELPLAPETAPTAE